MNVVFKIYVNRVRLEEFLDLATKAPSFEENEPYSYLHRKLSLDCFFN
jgi:hypothetical protein